MGGWVGSGRRAQGRGPEVGQVQAGGGGRGGGHRKEVTGRVEGAGGEQHWCWVIGERQAEPVVRMDPALGWMVNQV